VQADAELNTGKPGEQVRDFDRPLEPGAATKAEAAADAAGAPEYALLGARHDLNYAGAKTPTCQCLAVALSDHAEDPAFQWELAAPKLEPSTQLVIAFTSNGVTCDSPPAGTLGASYQGYAIDGNDVVISVDTARRQAAERQTPVGAELDRLLIHGVLHLLGYDHERSAAEARRMQRRERDLARRLAG